MACSNYCINLRSERAHDLFIVSSNKAKNNYSLFHNQMSEKAFGNSGNLDKAERCEVHFQLCILYSQEVTIGMITESTIRFETKHMISTLRLHQSRPS